MVLRLPKSLATDKLRQCYQTISSKIGNVKLCKRELGKLFWKGQRKNADGLKS